MTGELILVVEDDVKSRRLVHDLLAHHGYRIAEAAAGDAGVRMAKELLPALVVMDIRLPVLDGISALRALRADPATRAIPVLAVSASAMPGDREQVRAAGFDAYQEKPIELPAFLARGARAARARRAIRPGARMSQARILVVDDTPRNVKLLAELLTGSGYDVVTAASGAEALAQVHGGTGAPPDLVLLDVLMPGMSGYDVCRAIRANPATATLPVVLVTALDATQERVAGIEAGADDFLSKPISQPELLARVRSLLHVKELHDTVRRQATQLAEWNRTLEDRVARQIDALERFGRLKRFLPPQIAERVLAGDAVDPLHSHRCDIVALFLELRGLTLFAETRAPDELMAVLREYHAEVGRLVTAFEGAVERFTGEGVMIFFNDPVPQPDAAVRAVRLALAIRDCCRVVFARWEERGFELSLGAGVASGAATLGAIGFEARSDYAAIGTVSRLAVRLAEAAQANEILLSQSVATSAGTGVLVEPAGEHALRGFLRPVAAHRATGERAPARATSPALPAADRARNAFRRNGEYWTLRFAGQDVRLRDSKGLFYLAQLLRHREQDVPALTLVSLLRADGAAPPLLDTSDLVAGGLGDAGVALDPAAKSAYRSRLSGLRTELAEADSFNDAERASRIRREIEFLSRQLAAAVGLGGRDLPVAAAAERARVNVTRAISDAVKRIREHAPALARHLDASIRTGALCSYRSPDPEQPDWEL